MNRMQKAVREASETARHILVRNVPRTSTSGDLRRALVQADVKGVDSVDLLYTHFRPTGKALLTMSLPDYTLPAVRGLEDLNVAGSPVSGEPIYNIWSLRKGLLGDGPSAGLEAGTTVTMSGFPGKTHLSDVYKWLKDFDVKQITAVAIPEKKFSLYSRFAVQLKSESEAHRLVRKYHMTNFHRLDSAPPIRAELIY